MSSPSIPQDNSVQVEQMQENAASQAAAQAKTDAATQAANLAALRTSSAGNATTATDNYFQQQGLDPTKYSGDIDSQINQLLNGIDPTDTNPGSTFDTAPKDIYNTLTASNQNQNLAAVNDIFSPNYGETKATNALTDPYVSSIEQTQYGNADDLIKNMLARGVITPTGQAAAEAELQRQAPSVTDQLNQIGQGVVSGEQSSLDAIANSGRQAAQTSALGQSFDPSTYGSEADQQFNDFVNNLGNTMQGKVTGNLFNTSSLASIAGAGQGAGNTNFDPTAAAGIISPTANDGSTDSTTGKPVNTGVSNSASAVF